MTCSSAMGQRGMCNMKRTQLHSADKAEMRNMVLNESQWWSSIKPMRGGAEAPVTPSMVIETAV